MDIVVSKDQFIDRVISLLKQRGFEGEGHHFILQRTITQPGRTIVINGRQMNEPPKEIPIQIFADIIGDGYIADKDDTIEREFTSIRFTSGGSVYEECFYWDDINYFTEIFNKIIK